MLKRVYDLRYMDGSLRFIVEGLMTFSAASRQAGSSVKAPNLGFKNQEIRVQGLGVGG
jgi:hypothetical protein